MRQFFAGVWPKHRGSREIPGRQLMLIRSPLFSLFPLTLSLSKGATYGTIEIR
jgi:hypothetical protein